MMTPIEAFELRNFIVGSPIKLDTFQNSVPQADKCIPPKACAYKKKEDTMYVEHTKTDFGTQRSYAATRLGDLYSKLNSGLIKQFGLVNDEPPRSFEDLLARIQAGKYVFPEDKKTKSIGVYGVMDYIQWRDPAVKEDQAGYDAAIEKLSAAYNDAQDNMALASDAAGVKAAVDAFKAWTLPTA
jgi:hypothetical protein